MVDEIEEGEAVAKKGFQGSTSGGFKIFLRLPSTIQMV